MGAVASTAKRQLKELERLKADPKNTLQIESLEKTLMRRMISD